MREKGCVTISRLKLCCSSSLITKPNRKECVDADNVCEHSFKYVNNILNRTHIFAYICQRPISDSGQCWIINSFMIKSSYFYDPSWKINGSLIEMFVPWYLSVPNHHIAYYNYTEKTRVSFS